MIVRVAGGAILLVSCDFCVTFLGDLEGIVTCVLRGSGVLVLCFEVKGLRVLHIFATSCVLLEIRDVLLSGYVFLFICYYDKV